MKFLDRISSGLVNPNRIKTFSKDKFGLVFGYFLFLVIVALIPVVISVITRDYLDYQTQTEIKNILSSEKIPFEIIDNKLTFVGEGSKKDYYLFEDDYFSFYFTDKEKLDSNTLYASSTRTGYFSSLSRNGLRIIMARDGIRIAVSLIDVEVCKYSDFSEFNGLDFTNTNINNSDLWEPLMSAYAKVVSKYVPTINTVYIIIYVISTIANLIIFSLLITLISRIGYKLYSFKENWKLVIYCMMGYVLGDFVSVLTGASIFGFIGIIITVAFAFNLNRVGGIKNEL